MAIAALATLAVLELGARAVTGRWLAWGPAEDRGSHGLADPLLGRVPRPGLQVRVRDRFTITTGEHGTRSHGAQRPARDRPLTLVVGDSFAFGDEVDDADTWPAALERALGSRVVNAAVPGFGLDQSVLRAEALAPVYAPDRIVVAFIPHDVRRCEMSIWSGNAKPWLEIGEGGELMRHAPETGWARDALGPILLRSVLIDALFSDVLQRDGPDTVEHRRGGDVACLLLDRVAALRARGAEIVIVAEPQGPVADAARYRDPEGAAPRETDLELVARVLGCARARGLRTIDLVAELAALEPAHRDRLFHGHGHHTREGNRWVADRIAAALAR